MSAAQSSTGPVVLYMVQEFAVEVGLAKHDYPNWKSTKKTKTEIEKLQRQYGWPDEIKKASSMHGTPVPLQILLQFAKDKYPYQDSDTKKRMNEAIDNITKFEIGPWTPPLKNANGKVLTQYCRVCYKQKPKTAFAKGRTNHCNLCRRGQQKEREKDITEKTCDGCGKTKEASKFDVGRRKCQRCHFREGVISNQSNPEKTRDARLSAESHPEECNLCSKPFDEKAFGWASDKCCFKARCKECLNTIGREKGYKALWWAKNKEEGGSAFMDESARRCKAFRDNNPDKQRAYVLRQATNADAKIKTYRSRAERMNKVFNEDEIDKLALKFLEPCFYCGREHDPTAEDEDDRKLNGLDRIDNEGPYSDANTVPACKMCNFMKRTMTLDDFTDIVTKIAEENPRENVECLAYSAWKSKGARFGFVKQSDHIEGKNKRLIRARRMISRSKEFQAHVLCYLCKRPFDDARKRSVDRIDSRLNTGENFGYTVANTMAACIPCNKMKKDMDLELFLKQCNQVRTI